MSDVLFDGDDALFKQVLSSAERADEPFVYGEYGCGLSTRWVLNHTAARIFSIDSSEGWIANVRDNVAAERASRFNPKWADLGEIENWGRPASYSHERNFELYTNWIWQQDQKPSIVLIDARFRVCCFLTCLKFADPGTFILFDDYSNRGIYHIVERVLTQFDVCGRQVCFEVPERDKIDFELVEDLVGKFRYVMD